MRIGMTTENQTIFVFWLALLLATLYIKYFVGLESLTRCKEAQIKNVVLSNWETE